MSGGVAPPRDPRLADIAGLHGRIAIFGGTFDPIHLGHLEAAARAEEHFHLDAVVFVPASQNRLKSNRPLGGDNERLELIADALRPVPEFFVSSIEVDRGGPSVSIDTVRRFHSELDSGCKLYFLLGSDCLPALGRWVEPSVLFSIAEPIVVERRGFGPETVDSLESVLSEDQLRAMRTNWLPPVSDAASTEIRERIASGADFGDMVPASTAGRLKTYGRR